MKSLVKQYRLSRYHVRAIKGLTAFLMALMIGTILYSMQLQEPDVFPALQTDTDAVVAKSSLNLLTFASHRVRASIRDSVCYDV